MDHTAGPGAWEVAPFVLSVYVIVQSVRVSAHHAAQNRQI
jgi:hypothetical protein